MIRLRHKLFIHALRGVDQALLYTSLVAACDWVGRATGDRSISHVLQETYRPSEALGLVALIIGWILIFNRLVSYQTNRFTTLKDELMDLLKASSVSAFLLLIVSAGFSFRRINNEVVVVFWIGATALTMVTRVAARYFLTAIRRQGYNYRHLLIIGHNPESLQLGERLESLPELGYKITGYVSERPVSGDDPKVVGELKDIQRILEQHSTDEMIVCLPVHNHVNAMFELVRLAQELGIVVRLFPGPGANGVLRRFHIERFEGDYVITLFREQLLLQLLGKRLLDFVASLVLITLLGPILLAVAIIIKVTSPGPVLFVQKRVGMNKRIFNLYKFRSMYVDAEKRKRELEHLNEMDGPVFKIKNDPRITPFGRFIRKTSIDELPQLFNVLTGHMSLVGPRPPIPEEVDRYEWLYRKRLSIKPGITCLWQISGRNHISFKQWMELDQQYIDNWSLWLDIRILLKTVPAVLFLRGAS